MNIHSLRKSRPACPPPAAPAAPAAAATLDTVKERGRLICGVNTGLAGFSAADSQGNWVGLNALGTGVLGNGGSTAFWDVAAFGLDGIPPVVACIGLGIDGRLFNVNADTLAGHLAARLRARRLVIAGTTAGVLDEMGDYPEGVVLAAEAVFGAWTSEDPAELRGAFRAAMEPDVKMTRAGSSSAPTRISLPSTCRATMATSWR